jgi:protein-S-isoprenylcysteine O-methyltransferase Ste14
MKWIDLPPVWLAGFAACVWFAPIVNPFLPAQSWIGAALVGVGVLMMCLAVIEMSRHRTTVVPHLQATSLVTSGIFGLSRNPIYLGDAFVLAGLVLRWQAHPALILLVPAFMYVIAFRFIKSEEMRLKTGFGDAFAKYCDTTRRWL